MAIGLGRRDGFDTGADATPCEQEDNPIVEAMAAAFAKNALRFMIDAFRLTQQF